MQEWAEENGLQAVGRSSSVVCRMSSEGRRSAEGDGLDGCMDARVGIVRRLWDRVLLRGGSDIERVAGGDGMLLLLCIRGGNGLHETLSHAQARMGVYSTTGRMSLNLWVDLSSLRSF